MKFVILVLNVWLEHQILSSFSLPKLRKRLEEKETFTTIGVS